MFAGHIWVMSYGVVELSTHGTPDGRSPFLPEKFLKSGINIYLRGLGSITQD
jgi:hypothetical protein